MDSSLHAHLFAGGKEAGLAAAARVEDGHERCQLVGRGHAADAALSVLSVDAGTLACQAPPVAPVRAVPAQGRTPNAAPLQLPLKLLLSPALTQKKGSSTSSMHGNKLAAFSSSGKLRSRCVQSVLLKCSRAHDEGPCIASFASEPAPVRAKRTHFLAD